MAKINARVLCLALALIALVVMFEVASAQYGRGHHGGRRYGGGYGGWGGYGGGRGSYRPYNNWGGRGGGYYGGRGYREDYGDMPTYSYDQPGYGYYDDSMGSDDYSSYMDGYSTGSSGVYSASSASTASTTPQSTLVGSGLSRGTEITTGWSSNSEMAGASNINSILPRQWQLNSDGSSSSGQQPELTRTGMNGFDLIASSNSGRGLQGATDKRAQVVSGRPGGEDPAIGSILPPQVPSSTTTSAPEYVMINSTERHPDVELNDQDE